MRVPLLSCRRSVVYLRGPQFAGFHAVVPATARIIKTKPHALDWRQAVKCSRCRQPTPIWKRDIFSGLCWTCRQPDQEGAVQRHKVDVDGLGARILRWIVQDTEVQRHKVDVDGLGELRRHIGDQEGAVERHKVDGSVPDLLMRLGALVLIGGLAGAIYFFFIFDTTVTIESRSILGEVYGGQKVHNIGLMAQRQNGLIISIGAAVLAAIVMGIGHFMREQLTANKPAALPQSKLCAHCGKYYAENPAFCPNCGKPLNPPGVLSL